MCVVSGRSLEILIVYRGFDMFFSGLRQVSHFRSVKDKDGDPHPMPTGKIKGN